MLRGKEGYDTHIAEMREQEGPASATRMGSKKPTFMGFVVPEKPRPPADDGEFVVYHMQAVIHDSFQECCMSGCAICVYDLYDEAVKDYNTQVSTIRRSLEALQVPKEQWPSSLRTKRGSGKDTVPKKSITLSAFEELERRLKEKHGSRAEGQ